MVKLLFDPSCNSNPPLVALLWSGRSGGSVAKGNRHTAPVCRYCNSKPDDCPTPSFSGQAPLVPSLQLQVTVSELSPPVTVTMLGALVCPDTAAGVAVAASVARPMTSASPVPT